MRNLCSKCPNRNNCTTLCDKAKKYADQDYTSIREVYLEGGDVSEVFKNVPVEKWTDLLKENTYLSKKEKEIVVFLGRGLNRSDICQLLNITKKTLRNHIYKIRKKYLN